MRIPTVLFAGAIALAGCDTMMGPPPPSPPVATAGAMGSATLTTATNNQFGTFVVDGGGRSVYILDGTRGGSGINRCSGQCLAVWPPLMIRGTPGAAMGIDQAQLRAVSGYGGTQVSYMGWPLYYYQRDEEPGQTNGQGVRDQWGTWYLIRPTGELVRMGGGY